MKKFFSFLFVFTVLCISFVPYIVTAQVTNDTVGGQQTGAQANTGITYECMSKDGAVTTYGNCTYDDLILAVKKVIDWGIKFGLMFSVVVIAYAGILLLTSGDSPKQRGQAKDMLMSVVKGIAYMLAAWLIVNLITSALLKDDVLKAVPVRNT